MSDDSLLCVAPAQPPLFEIRAEATRPLRAGEVLVRQSASAINPIDTRRAAGYGRKLLALKGAASFPLVLGNDVSGTVVDPGDSGFLRGTPVFGLVPTGAQGAYNTHVRVPRELLRPLPAACDPVQVAALPYSFTTAWLALRGAGLDAQSARGRKVLVNGAGGGLGQLALQMLGFWGARVTAVDREATFDRCRALGAEACFACGPGALDLLPRDYGAVINFAAWESDAALSARLGPGGLGHATTVHPLLGNFDALGLLRGALANWRQYSAARSRVRARSPQARYAWTVFKPSPEALDELERGLVAHRIEPLPVGWTGPLGEAPDGFAHLAQGRPGRAVLRMP